MPSDAERSETAELVGAQPATRRRGPLARVVVLLLPILIVLGLYYAVTGGIRFYVDTQIEAPVGQPVEDFELTDIDGKVWRASELRGRAIVLHFFRSQCASCHAMRDDMKRFARDLDPEKVQVLYIMVDKVQGYPQEMSARTILDMAFDGPVILVDDSFVDAFHGSGWSQVTPITYLVNQEGKVSAALRGRVSYQELVDFVPSGLMK